MAERRNPLALQSPAQPPRHISRKTDRLPQYRSSDKKPCLHLYGKCTREWGDLQAIRLPGTTAPRKISYLLEWPRMSADTTAVRVEAQFDIEALSSYLEREGFSHGRRISVEQFPGGHSNLTYLLQLDGGGEYVLRRPPLGPVAPKAHDMVREFHLLRAVHPVFPPAPEPALLCEDLSILGAPFYLMERRRGLVVRRENPPEIGDDIRLRRRVGEALLDTLVQLHAIDVTQPPVSSIGKPAG